MKEGEPPRGSGPYPLLPRLHSEEDSVANGERGAEQRRGEERRGEERRGEERRKQGHAHHHMHATREERGLGDYEH